jgi:hypothetical protein
MASIKKWLEVNGYTFKQVIMTNGTKGLMVDTNYDGPYVTAETWRKQGDIFNKVRRFKSLECESRGCFTAVLIIEKADSAKSA